MDDNVEASIAPAAIERALGIFEKFKDREHTELVQARKALTDHIFGQVAAGQTDRRASRRMDRRDGSWSLRASAAWRCSPWQ
jgi:hypothetical protein